MSKLCQQDPFIYCVAFLSLGSGKSTWAEEQMTGWENVSRIISRDKIRFSLLKEGEDYFKRENAVFAQFIKEINDSIKAGIENIFIDATHINSRSRAKVLKRIKFPEKCKLKIEVFTTSIETCLVRNRQREGFALVPDSVIKSMAHDFEFPHIKEFTYIQDKVPDIVIYEHNEWRW